MYIPAQYVQTSAPDTEPVSLDQARAFLELDADITDDNQLLERILIPAARKAAEMRTHRSLISQEWRLTMDAFPCRSVIELWHGPVQDVQSLRYFDTAYAEQTLPDDQYVVVVGDELARLGLIGGQVWPSTGARIGAVMVDFTAGYGDDGDDVPEPIRHWILMRLRSLWEYRSEDVALLNARLQKPSFIDGLLDGFCIPL